MMTINNKNEKNQLSQVSRFACYLLWLCRNIQCNYSQRMFPCFSYRKATAKRQLFCLTQSLAVDFRRPVLTLHEIETSYCVEETPFPLKHTRIKGKRATMVSYIQEFSTSAFWWVLFNSNKRW